MSFKEELKEVREEWCLTQPEMAKKLGISLPTYKNLEIYGGGYDGTFPSATTCAKLRKAGVWDYSYKEIIAMIRHDRMVEGRRRKGNRTKRKKGDE